MATPIETISILSLHVVQNIITFAIRKKIGSEALLRAHKAHTKVAYAVKSKMC